MDAESEKLDRDHEEAIKEQQRDKMELDECVEEYESMRKRIHDLKLSIMEESKTIHTMSCKLVCAIIAIIPFFSVSISDS